MAMGMTGAARSMRIHAENKHLERIIADTVNKLIEHPEQSVRVTTKQARFVLIRHETVTANGRIHKTYVRNVGAGVKEVYLKKLG